MCLHAFVCAPAVSAPVFRAPLEDAKRLIRMTMHMNSRARYSAQQVPSLVLLLGFGRASAFRLLMLFVPIDVVMSGALVSAIARLSFYVCQSAFAFRIVYKCSRLQAAITEPSTLIVLHMQHGLITM